MVGYVPFLVYPPWCTLGYTPVYTPPCSVPARSCTTTRT